MSLYSAGSRLLRRLHAVVYGLPGPGCVLQIGEVGGPHVRSAHGMVFLQETIVMKQDVQFHDGFIVYLRKLQSDFNHKILRDDE